MTPFCHRTQRRFDAPGDGVVIASSCVTQVSQMVILQQVQFQFIVVLK
jgi:hypothetical protein